MGTHLKTGSKRNGGLRAVLFDVDGTLADTERDGHRPAFNAAFSELGLDWDWDVELYGELLAITGGKSASRIGLASNAPRLLSERWSPQRRVTRS